jgi:ketosteroid isomerase-like protein
VTQTLRELSDRLEIEQLLIRCCHAIDRRDWDTYRSTYTADALIADADGGPGTSVDEMIRLLTDALEKVVLTQHTISTIVVDIDGDTARARAVCQCPVVLDRGSGDRELYFQGFWYEDELVRTAGGWRITRRAERDYFHNLPPDFSFE